MKTIVVYIPVIHQGYLNMINEVDPDRVLVISDEVMDLFDLRRKDIRAVSSKVIVSMLKVLFPRVRIDDGTVTVIQNLSSDEQLWMPDEDISDLVTERFLSGRSPARCSWFLRYDHKRSLAPVSVVADRTISSDDPLIKKILGIFLVEAEKSSDFWRQVPSVVAKNGEILGVAHNQHVPHAGIPYELGDPRSNFNKGVNTHISTGAHSEASLLVSLGRGVCEGADLYVGTFPCPFCANVIPFSGLARLFFHTGYAMLEGVEVIRSAGIEIIQIV